MDILLCPLAAPPYLLNFCHHKQPTSHRVGINQNGVRFSKGNKVLHTNLTAKAILCFFKQSFFCRKTIKAAPNRVSGPQIDKRRLNIPISLLSPLKIYCMETPCIPILLNVLRPGDIIRLLRLHNVLNAKLLNHIQFRRSHKRKDFQGIPPTKGIPHAPAAVC